MLLFGPAEGAAPDYYLSQLKAYSRFVRNFNPEQQQDPHRMLKIAVGPGGDGPRWMEWTETIMKMDRLVATHSAIMDKPDPQKKVALVVDEWGGWYAPLPGSNPGLPGPAEQPPRRRPGRAQSVAAQVQGGKLSLTLAPRSVTVISVGQ
jgi:hypothetical protein